MSKSNVVIVVIAIAILLATGNAQVNRTQSTVGRYQLLAGETDFVGKTSISAQKGVFRIDTETGETAIYNAGFDKEGKPYQEWTPIRPIR